MGIPRETVTAAQGHLVDFGIGLNGQTGHQLLIAKKDISVLFDAFARLDQRMRMLLRRDGKLVVSCTRIGDMLDLGSCLRLVKGKVGVADLKFKTGFQDLLSVKSPGVMTLALPCTKNGGHILIRATSTHDLIVCVSLRHANESEEPELPDLEKVFHLTKTEAMIVKDLFSGHTPQMIADDHNNSVHTVRAHIRRCYDKLEITCREELWSKLNAYRLY